jgi:hypothetical protein
MVNIQKGHVFAFELIPQDFYGNKKFTLGLTDLSIGGQSTTRNDTVHMHMVIQLLIPGVEYLDNARCCPEILLISR